MITTDPSHAKHRLLGPNDIGENGDSPISPLLPAYHELERQVRELRDKVVPMAEYHQLQRRKWELERQVVSLEIQLAEAREDKEEGQ